MIILNLICLISRNMAAPQQIEQVRLPLFAHVFPPAGRLAFQPMNYDTPSFFSSTKR